MQDYEDVVKRLGALYEEVCGCEFYEEMFPDNERSGDTYEGRAPHGTRLSLS